MKLLIQRVTEASVSVNNQTVSKIGRGILVLLGIHIDDDKSIAKKLAQKLPKIRLWDSIITNQKQNEEIQCKSWDSSVQDNGYEILIVSQFTLYNVMKGNKPDFHLAKKSDDARILYNFFMDELSKAYSKDKIQGGVFQQMMQVQLINDGPVTIEIEEIAQQKQQQQQKQKVGLIQSAKELDFNQTLEQ